ncbi:TPA: twin-arginine translocation signal domain-containing protein [Candidatus Poribacteria bacterium]|nr:twin-arginine translocation signal domain-containing protein [Candidatus Poribacteria bacterium]
MEKNLDRRSFLKTTLVGASSVAVLGGISKSL